MSNKSQLLQDPFLNALRREHVPVSIYLVNGIKLQGQIESFDQYVVLLRNTVTQMVYKHAISTIVINSIKRSLVVKLILWSCSSMSMKTYGRSSVINDTIISINSMKIIDISVQKRNLHIS